MSDFIKNNNEWCRLDPIQPNADELRQEIANRPWHPLLRGLKRTKCGSLVGGMPHPRPLDACTVCVDCETADDI